MEDYKKAALESRGSEEFKELFRRVASVFDPYLRYVKHAYSTHKDAIPVYYTRKYARLNWDVGKRSCKSH